MSATLTRFFVYQCLFSDGRTAYSVVDEFGERFVAGLNINELAKNFADEVRVRRLQYNFSLSFTPPFDILISLGTITHRCVKLVEGQQLMFWCALKECGFVR